MVGPTPSLALEGPLFDADAALAARLAEAFPPQQFQHDIVPARFDKRTWDRLTRRTPFVGRGWANWTAEKNAGRVFRGVAAWSVFLVDRNGRTDALTRGDAFAPGTFAMAQVAAAALHGWTVTNVGTWFIDGLANAYSDEWGDESSGLVTLSASVQLDMASSAVFHALPEFLRLGTTWTIPPIGAETLSVRGS